MKLFSLEPYFGKRICVALSGGADSVCLLHYFAVHAKECKITLSAIHIEHGIRGEESLSDMHFCERLCKEWGIPLRVISVDLPKLAKQSKTGLEETGRRVRYNAFQEALTSGQCELVATAHHVGDTAETVLFRLARGTALSGMRAITEHDGIVRPLLNVTREQIETYISENGLSYVEDKTNSDETYTRNYIRHSVLPAFEQITKHATGHLVRFASLAADDDEYLYELARSNITLFQGDSYVPAELPVPLFYRACLICMGAEKDYTGANLEEIAKLKGLQSGKRVCLPGGQEAAREYDKIVFYYPEPPMTEQPFLADYGGEPGIMRESGTLRFDLDAFPKSCVIRNRREGDFIVPFGGKKKSLKKFLTDKKISARLGKKLKLIADGSEILAVISVEISEKVKVTEKTVRIGYIN